MLNDVQVLDVNTQSWTTLSPGENSFFGGRMLMYRSVMGRVMRRDHVMRREMTDLLHALSLFILLVQSPLTPLHVADNSTTAGVTTPLQRQYASAAVMGTTDPQVGGTSANHLFDFLRSFYPPLCLLQLLVFGGNTVGWGGGQLLGAQNDGVWSFNLTNNTWSRVSILVRGNGEVCGGGGVCHTPEARVRCS